MHAVTSRAADELTVEFAGEEFPVAPGTVFSVGREGDLAIDDNLFLHRNFLTIQHVEGLWLLSNVGSRLTATVTDSGGRVQAWLAPGARLPLVFASTSVIFSAGPTTYELTIHAAEPAFRETQPEAEDDDGLSTIGDVPLTHSQRLMILALAEPVLKREGTGMSELPTSSQAAERLGWTLTRFNRKLDNVCDKLDRIGVPGLRGGVRSYATNRRVRLVEHALAARLVTRDDLPLLDLERDLVTEDEA
ncbi:hypothetical protein ACLKM7_07490 [Microbacterium sp. I2]|uniref:hypothetical protein n=1 Tax=Microbacterium sp. I2 TaxID=3391826 RepID=UPI003EDAA9EF